MQVVKRGIRPTSGRHTTPLCHTQSPGGPPRLSAQLTAQELGYCSGDSERCKLFQAIPGGRLSVTGLSRIAPYQEPNDRRLAHQHTDNPPVMSRTRSAARYSLRIFPQPPLLTRRFVEASRCGRVPRTYLRQERRITSLRPRRRLHRPTTSQESLPSPPCLIRDATKIIGRRVPSRILWQVPRTDSRHSIMPQEIDTLLGYS